MRDLFNSCLRPNSTSKNRPGFSQVKHQWMGPVGQELATKPLVTVGQRQFRLRCGQMEDLSAMVDLERAGYGGYLAWDYTDFLRDWQKNRLAVYIVLVELDPRGLEKEGLVGLISGRFVEGRSHISNFIVDPARQSQGLGSQLLEAWMEATHQSGRKQVTLEVRESNLQAQKLYYKYGFQLDHKKYHYYEDNGETAYYLACKLF